MKLIGVAASIGLLILVVFLDRVTSYELNLTGAYGIPIMVAAWYGGRKYGVPFAVVAAGLCIFRDFQSGHPYSREIYRYWGGGMRIVGFVVLSVLVARIRQALDLSKQLAEEKAAALRELEEATARLRQLEGTFQTVCSWTNRIRDGDEWITLEQYLSRHLKIELTHGISPEGKKLFLERKAGDTTQAPYS